MCYSLVKFYCEKPLFRVPTLESSDTARNEISGMKFRNVLKIEAKFLSVLLFFVMNRLKLRCSTSNNVRTNGVVFCTLGIITFTPSFDVSLNKGIVIIHL